MNSPLHAPEFECIDRGKLRRLDAFGINVSVAARRVRGLIVGTRRYPVNRSGKTAAATEKSKKQRGRLLPGPPHRRQTNPAASIIRKGVDL